MTNYLSKIFIIMLCWNSLYGSSESPKLAQHDGASFSHSLSHERIEQRKLHYLGLCKSTSRNKKLLWLSGGACATGLVAYLIKSYFFPDPVDYSKAPTITNARYTVSSAQDAAFTDWIENQKERRTLKGAAKNAVVDGVRMAIVSVVVGIIVRQFDNATFDISGKIKSIIGYDEDEVFDVVQQRVGANVEHVSGSLDTLVTELQFLSQQTGRQLVAPSFFFGFLSGDTQALGMHVEDITGLMLALAEFLKPKDAAAHNAIQYQVNELLGAYQELLTFCSQLKDSSIPQAAQRVEALYAIKKLSVALGNSVSLVKNRLFA